MEGYKGVVMLNHPPIDKVCAKVVLERHLGHPLPVAEYYGNPVCPIQQMLEWDERGLFPIDIGDEKYNRTKGQFGSATEAVVDILHLLPTEIEKQLIKILREHNKTGYLKAGKFSSAAWLIRELYELDGYDQTEIIEQTGRMIHVWFKTEEIDNTTANRATLFTVGQFLRNLERLVRSSADEIQEERQWWIKAASDVEVAFEKARDEYNALPKTKFPAGNFRATAIATDSYFVSKVAARDPETDILLVRRSTGHTAFLSRGLDISDLAREVKTLEPDDRWYHHQGPGQLINGGKVYGGAECGAAKPTALSKEKMMELLQRFPPQKRMVARQPSQSSRLYRR